MKSIRHKTVTAWYDGSSTNNPVVNQKQAPYKHTYIWRHNCQKFNSQDFYRMIFSGNNSAHFIIDLVSSLEEGLPFYNWTLNPKIEKKQKKNKTNIYGERNKKREREKGRDELSFSWFVVIFVFISMRVVPCNLKSVLVRSESLFSTTTKILHNNKQKSTNI